MVTYTLHYSKALEVEILQISPFCISDDSKHSLCHCQHVQLKQILPSVQQSFTGEPIMKRKQ